MQVDDDASNSNVNMVASASEWQGQEADEEKWAQQRWARQPFLDFPTGPDDRGTRMSNLERLPIEVLRQIYVWSGNLSLLATSKAVRGQLNDFLTLARLAFSRENFCCTDDLYSNIRTQNCLDCDRAETGPHPIENEIHTRYDPNAPWMVYRSRVWREGAPTHGYVFREDQCVHIPVCGMTFNEKRHVQDQVLASPWFTLRLASLIESECTVCARDMEWAYKELCKELPFDPLDGRTFAGSPLTQFHRRHLVHGVRLPDRLFWYSRLSSSRIELLQKLKDWTTEGPLLRTACRKYETHLRTRVLDMLNQAVRDENIPAVRVLAEYRTKEPMWNLLHYALVEEPSSAAMVEALFDTNDYNSGEDNSGRNDFDSIMAATARRRGREIREYEALEAYLVVGDSDETMEQWMSRKFHHSQEREKRESAELSAGYNVDPFEATCGVMGTKAAADVCKWLMCQEEGWEFDHRYYNFPLHELLASYSMDWECVQGSGKADRAVMAISKTRQKMDIGREQLWDSLSEELEDDDEDDDEDYEEDDEFESEEEDEGESE